MPGVEWARLPGRRRSGRGEIDRPADRGKVTRFEYASATSAPCVSPGCRSRLRLLPHDPRRGRTRAGRTDLYALRMGGGALLPEQAKLGDPTRRSWLPDAAHRP